MVRPVSLQGFQKGFQGVSLRGFRGFQIFLWEFMCLYQIPQLRGAGRGSGGSLGLVHHFPRHGAHQNQREDEGEDIGNRLGSLKAKQAQGAGQDKQ